jgi:NADH:ubiquinone oxidoreductase subunit D
MFTRIKLIRARNHKIRHAAEAITPLSLPNNQQAIRVIREEVDRIEWALTEIIPG